MKGRNENAVKNRYVSIIRNLKKQAKKDPKKIFEQTDIKSVIKVFLEGKQMPISSKKENINDEKIIKNEEIPSILTLQPSLPGNLNPSESLMNLETNFPVGTYEPNNKLEKSRLIYDFSNFFIPNMYLSDNNNNNRFPPQKNFLNLRMQENSFFEMDEISQSMSSLSLSDQILNEANEILSNNSSIFAQDSFLSFSNNEQSSSLIHSSPTKNDRNINLLGNLVDQGMNKITSLPGNQNSNFVGIRRNSFSFKN